MIRSGLRIPRLRVRMLTPQLASQQRSLHNVPKLDHDFSDGVPGLFSADGFHMAWTQQMTYTLDKLNALIAGSCAPK